MRGDLDRIAMPSGRQAFLSRLEQIMGPAPGQKPVLAVPEKPLPVDRGRAFAERAAELLRAAVVRCEERYPLEGAHSAIVVVVDRDAALWKERLSHLHGEFYGLGVVDPLSPVKLEVIDRATDEAIRRLTELGLVQPATRAVRLLHPLEAASGPVPLSEEERLRMEGFRQVAVRKVKMARALLNEELVEEGREALLQAVQGWARATAVANRLPDPVDIGQAVCEPLGTFWGEARATIQAYASCADAPWKPVISALATLGVGA
jgi:hypothetical protein